MIYTGTYYLFICYIVTCISVYRYMRKNNKPIRSENLTLGQIFFKKGFIWLVWGNSFIKQSCLPLHTIQNDYNFSRLCKTTYLKGVGGANYPLHPHFKRKGGAPDPLYPSLDTGLEKTDIIFIVMFRTITPYLKFQYCS